MKTAELRMVVLDALRFSSKARAQTKSRKVRKTLRELDNELVTLFCEIPLLAQRKFADGWDASLAKVTHQPNTFEVRFDSAGDIPQEYARD